MSTQTSILKKDKQGNTIMSDALTPHEEQSLARVLKLFAPSRNKAVKNKLAAHKARRASKPAEKQFAIA